MTITVMSKKYAQLFEKHFNELIQRPKYKPLIDEIYGGTPVDAFHNGYFSIDKKGRLQRY